MIDVSQVADLTVDRTGPEHDAAFQALLEHADRDGISRGELAVEVLAESLNDKPPSVQFLHASSIRAALGVQS